MTYAIQLAGEAPPTYFSLRAARDFGSPHGWTADQDQALQFGRQKDAESFRDTYLMHQAQAGLCTIATLERTA